MTVTQSIIIRDGRKDLRVDLDEIIALEAEGDYTRFLLVDQKDKLISKRIGFYQDVLPESIFLRLSRSLFINREKIQVFDIQDRDLSFLHLRGVSKPFSLKRKATKTLRDAIINRV